MTVSCACAAEMAPICSTFRPDPATQREIIALLEELAWARERALQRVNQDRDLMDRAADRRVRLRSVPA